MWGTCVHNTKHIENINNNKNEFGSPVSDCLHFNEAISRYVVSSEREKNTSNFNRCPARNSNRRAQSSLSRSEDVNAVFVLADIVSSQFAEIATPGAPTILH